MTARGIKRKAILILVTTFVCFCMIFDCRAYGAVDASLLTDLNTLPGVKIFDFSLDPVRENIPEASMVGPEYSIKLTKKLPDEYFGIPTVQQQDPTTGEMITGVFVQRDGGDTAKGACGCIYRKMFQYKGQWIDVKTTYMDWQCQINKYAFMCGGFANYKWKYLWYLEMKHEFFLADTDIPVQVKGYLEYSDIDNSQGMLLAQGEYDDIWANSGETVIGYRNIQAGTDMVHLGVNTHTIPRDMICIQSKTNEDVPEEGTEGYDRQTAAGTTFAYTFSGEKLHTALVDDDTGGFNILDNSSRKHVPCVMPGDDNAEAVKSVSDQDETEVLSNSVRSWQQWTYRVGAEIPIETEPGNMLSGFTIEDQIDPALDIVGVRVMRWDEDVSDLFVITEENNLVTASAENIDETSFYGYMYILEITVRMRENKDEMLRQNLLDENFEMRLNNLAHVKYEDGSGDSQLETNSTETTIQFEKEGDLVITKKTDAENIYRDHGDAVFIFRLKGQTASGQEKVFNRALIMEGDTGSVWFRNIPEGSYKCSEYETFRFRQDVISDITGGTAAGDTVDFTVDGSQVCRATFSNVRKNWDNYSDSSLAVNRLGFGNN